MRKTGYLQFHGPQHEALNELADVIAKPLFIFQRSWRAEEKPEDWRKASITPTFKIHKKEDPGSYRQVSLTSSPRKVMEQLNIISKHVVEENVIKTG